MHELVRRNILGLGVNVVIRFDAALERLDVLGLGGLLDLWGGFKVDKNFSWFSGGWSSPSLKFLLDKT